MRENVSNTPNTPKSTSGRTLQSFRKPVSRRMIANAETGPVEAIRSPFKRDGSGLKSEAIHTTSGATNAQTAIAPHNKAVPQNIVLKQLAQDRKSTRLNSSHMSISYAVFCLKKKRKRTSKHKMQTSNKR